MFFVLSKVLDQAANPIAWALLLIALGLWARPAGPRALASRTFLGRVRSVARFAPWVALVELFVLSTEPVSNALMRSLEVPVERTFRDDATYDAVIVLGGMVDSRVSATFATPAYEQGVERLLVAYELLRSGKARNALITGADEDFAGTRWSEARVLEAQLAAWGIESRRIALDERSRNTRENAVESARIVAREGWRTLLLVTSAGHMRRARGCFLAVGLDPDLLPVDFHSFDGPMTASGFLPRTGHLAESANALREYLGRTTYRLRGFSRAK